MRQVERAETATRPTGSAVTNVPATIDGTNVPFGTAVTTTPERAHITGSGVRAVEHAKHAPDERTDGFARYGTVVTHVHKHKTVIKEIKNSAVVAGSRKVKQKAKIKVAEIDPRTRAGVEDFLCQYHAKLPELEQEQAPKAVEIIAKKVDELQNQIVLPDGKKGKLKKAAESLREILEVGVGGVVTVGLLLALSGIPW
ncbi:hypothetical protein [Catenulispora rubra]|uniref:hypothetical protein n=1 Tax=Catenulispora rubra TaxID=280293 RepID=UPI00189234D3|nr:hypothetical protein [Catenulispora rubra]